MPRILCLHTADLHRATFGRLFAEAAPLAGLVQEVRADWLARAREDGVTPALEAEVSGYLAAQAGAHDAVLCTCSTLGPMVSKAAQTHPTIVRIDTPLMRAAARTPGTKLVALCLESTRDATLAQLDAAFAEAGRAPDRRLALCAEAWPLFETGDMQGFAEAIAARIRSEAARAPVGCVVLAQASMAVAEPLLADLDAPVYSSPALAVAETLRVADASAT